MPLCENLQSAVAGGSMAGWRHGHLWVTGSQSPVRSVSAGCGLILGPPGHGAEPALADGAA